MGEAGGVSDRSGHEKIFRRGNARYLPGEGDAP